MLRELRIQNLILISSATIHFDGGFNVLSGETGAGKSAIMKALYLLIGEKGDSSVIRHGSDKAIVEGLFEIEKIPGVLALLEQSNIEHQEGEDLIIRREISSAGKSRCTINNQSTQLALLRKIGSLLMEMVGQHANQKLLSLEHHRYIVDLFGNHLSDLAAFSRSWEQENQLAKEIERLITSESQRLRDIEVCRLEWEELEEARLKEGEEEELFAEYTRLANADEISAKIQEITQTLNGERISVIGLLKKHTQAFDQLSRLDPTYQECALSHKNALMELQEVAFTLERLSGHIENNSERLQLINDRLTLINKLKRKYGETISSIQAYQAQTKLKLENLESADIQIEEGKTKLALLKAYNNELAADLTAKRKDASLKLAESLATQLNALNMPKAQFQIDVTTQPRNSYGNDLIEFFLIPNVGEKRIPIKEHASGGELSRILLALQTLLAGKDAVTTLVFDEIDANIGGATAVVIGEKLKSIGQKHQVLCITHFPQVAKQADHHIQIEKREEEGRTLSHITRLDAKGRRKELERMSGLAK